MPILLFGLETDFGMIISPSAGSTRVATAAIRGWSLLLSTVPAWRMTTHSVEQSLQVLAVRNTSHYTITRAAWRHDRSCIVVTGNSHAS